MSVRETVAADLADIFSIQANSEIARNQFRRDADDCPERWLEWLAGSKPVDCDIFRCSSIVLDNAVVGYITQKGTDSNGIRCFSIGFNLLPEYWGRGIMRVSVTEVVAELFDQHDAEHVAVACFRNNARCRQLINGLGFRRCRLGLFARARVAYKMRCLHWICFHYTTKELWDKSRITMCDEPE